MGGKHPQPASRRGHSNTKEARVREAAQFNRVVSEGPTRLLESRSVCRPSRYNLLHYRIPPSAPSWSETELVVGGIANCHHAFVKDMDARMLTGPT